MGGLFFLIFFLPLVSSQGWQEMEWDFRVAEVPRAGTCSLLPETKGGLLGYKSLFTFSCSGWSDPEGGRLTYSLDYTSPEEGDGPAHLLYRGVRPSASHLILPGASVPRTYRAVVENEEEQATSIVIDTKELKPYEFSHNDMEKAIERLPMGI